MDGNLFLPLGLDAVGPPMTHGRFAVLVGLLFLFGVFAGCLSEEPAPKQGGGAKRERGIAPARDPNSTDFKPHVVVAVIDTGVNPYHKEFAEAYDFSDPADYIPGYPKDVGVLDLSVFSSPASSAAQDRNRDSKDAKVWSDTASQKLYRINNTKIIGLIGFDAGGLPGSGHGTMTASRATGNNISTGGAAIRLVMVKGFNVAAINWAASQPWIDIISISSGVTAGGIVPVAGNVLSPGEMKAFQEAAHKKPFYASSGNGIANAGLAGFPAWTRGPSGVPDVISVGANDNGKMSQWHNQHSYIVGDGCGNPSATDNTADRVTNSGGGTSSATPFSAGSGAKLLLEARRLLGDSHVGVRTSAQPIKSFSNWASGYADDAKIILAQGDASRAGIKEGPLADGVFTMQEFKDVVYHTAIAGGSEEKSDGDACVGLAGGYVPTAGVPTAVLAQFEGYGEVNGKSTDLAIKVIQGAAKNPTRSEEDIWYTAFHTVRTATLPKT